MHFPLQLTHKLYAKATRCLFFHVEGPHRHHTSKSVGWCWLAHGVHRVLYPSKSKVAEFLCKLKCLLPHATLYFDLHVDPLCCRMMDANVKRKKRKSVWGVGVVLLTKIIIILQSSAAKQMMTRDNVVFCGLNLAQRSCFWSAYFLLILCYVFWMPPLTVVHQPIDPNERLLAYRWFQLIYKLNKVTCWTLHNLSKKINVNIMVKYLSSV